MSAPGLAPAAAAAAADAGAGGGDAAEASFSSPPPDWEPRFSSLRLQTSRALGRGAFGEVCLVKAFPHSIAAGSSGAGDSGGAATAAAAYFALKRSSVALISEAGLERAKDEARLLQRLGEEHCSILRCFDFRVVPGSSPSLELLLEYAPLGDLAGRLRSHREQQGGANLPTSAALPGLPEAEVVSFACDVAGGLSHIHTLNPKVLHRDIKPANVVLFPLTGQAVGVPRAKIADFGIAKILETEGSFAGAATVIGTPHYFSPEICRGDKYDERSDAWALGCVIYEMLCLRRPFHQAEGNIAVLALRVMEGKYDKDALLQQAGRYNGQIIFLLVGLLSLDPDHRSRASDVLGPLMALRDSSSQSGSLGVPAVPWWESTLPAGEEGGGGEAANLADPAAQDDLNRASDPATDSWAGAHQVPLGSRPPSALLGRVAAPPDATLTRLPAEATAAAAAAAEEEVPAGQHLEEALLSATILPSPKWVRTAELLSYSSSEDNEGAAAATAAAATAALAATFFGGALPEPSTLFPPAGGSLAASFAASQNLAATLGAGAVSGACGGGGAAAFGGGGEDPPTIFPSPAGPPVVGGPSPEASDFGQTLRPADSSPANVSSSPYAEDLKATSRFDFEVTQTEMLGEDVRGGEPMGAQGAPSRLAWMGYTDGLMGLLSEPPPGGGGGCGGGGGHDEGDDGAGGPTRGAGVTQSLSGTAFSFGPEAGLDEESCRSAVPEQAEECQQQQQYQAHWQQQQQHAPCPGADQSFRCFAAGGPRIFLRPLWGHAGFGGGDFGAGAGACAGDGPVIFCFTPETASSAAAAAEAGGGGDGQPQAAQAAAPRAAAVQGGVYEGGHAGHRGVSDPAQGWLEVELTVENASAINQHLAEQYRRTGGIFSLTAVD